MGKIGFIGLGIMGKHMAYNLLKSEHRLVVYDICEDSMTALAQKGAETAASPRDVAEASSVVITMLPNGPQVKEVVYGQTGLLKGLKPDAIIIDMSSIAPAVSQEIAEDCKKAGIHFLDAPVSGGEPKAMDATLSIMVGGDYSAYEKVKDILLCMGNSAVYCGAVGAGNTVKLSNQIIVALNIAALSEAFLLARKANVDPSLVFEAIKGGLAGSAVMNAKAPMIMRRDFKPGFKVDLHIKDLKNALETGHKLGTPMPLTAIVMEMLQFLHATGDGDKDHCALVHYYEKLSDTTIEPYL